VEQGEDAYQGATVRVVYFDEELHDPRWRGVVRQSTMRVGADPVKLILSYAPKHGRIWIDEDYLDSGATHVRVHAIAALDNPHLRGEARAQLERTFAAMSPRERAAMSEGRALPREELVWPDWDPSVHLVDPPDPTGPGGCPADWPRYVGADFGYQSGNVVLWGALSPDGVLYVYRELYTVGWTGRANGLEAVRLSGSERIRKGWGDSSRPETIAEYQACGLPLGKADKGLEGLGAVAERLSGPALLDTCSECGGTGCGACDGSGRVVIRRGAPTLRVVRGTCPELTREIPGYVWEPGREQPRKRDDHACDALRYLVVGLGRRPAAPPVLGSRLSGLVRQSPWRNM
jgi:phage terminase large subunit